MENDKPIRGPLEAMVYALELIFADSQTRANRNRDLIPDHPMGIKFKRRMEIEMDINEILHILRNPYGKSKEEIRQAMLQAANLIESKLC